jgi:cysteine-rich repeat protein
MKYESYSLLCTCCIAGALIFFAVHSAHVYAVDEERLATTTVTVSVCGDGLVGSSEQCDIPGQTGGYSTTILGRQCTEQCLYDAYCGDRILQTTRGEECDDGNNVSRDFCSDICKVEPIAGGGGQ